MSVVLHASEPSSICMHLLTDLQSRDLHAIVYGSLYHATHDFMVKSILYTPQKNNYELTVNLYNYGG